MKKNKNWITLILIALIFISMSVFTFAASYSNSALKQGMSVLGGDEISFSSNTKSASLTARWGVRVVFLDRLELDENYIIKNSLVPINNNQAFTKAPAAPKIPGKTFVKWQRLDNFDKTVTSFNSKGYVTVIGRGPIVFGPVYKDGANPNTGENPIGLIFISFALIISLGSVITVYKLKKDN